MTENKRLFFICTRQFWPTSSGKDITLFYNCKGLSEDYGYDIYMVCFSNKDTDKGKKLPNFIKEVKYVDAPNLINAAINILGKSFSSKKWPFQNSLYYSKKANRIILDYYQKVNPQVLVVDMVRVVPYGMNIINKCHVNKKILIEDDLLSKRYLRQLQRCSTSGFAGNYESSLPILISKIINTRWIKNTILRAEIERLDKYEKNLPKLFDWITFISPIETAEFNKKFQTDKAITLTMGTDVRYFSEGKHEYAEPNSLSIAGDFNTSANAESLFDICNLILPELPKVKLYVFGKCPNNIKSVISNPNVVFKGFVDDIRKEVTSTQVFLSPISFGTGIKTKIVEAMAMGMPIVTNSIGAEGLNVRNGRELFIAETPEEIADTVMLLLNDPTLRKKVGEAAQEYVRKKHDWNIVYEAFGRMGL